jgi:DNA-binding CsgD family transcriptional regulator
MHLALRPAIGAEVHAFPHTDSRRAIAFGNLLDVRRSEEAALADTLDGMAAGFFLVDSLRRLMHANASGRAMLSRGDVLHIIGEKLSPVDREARKTFARNFAVADPGSAPSTIKAMAMPLPARDGERWMAHIRPLTPGSGREAGAGYSSAAAIFVRRVALDFVSSLETLVETFRLTPAEARVLGAVMEWGGVPEASRALQLSETTVKTHLRHIFEKTGTRRQTDLIKLAACFANPLGM